MILTALHEILHDALVWARFGCFFDWFSTQNSVETLFQDFQHLLYISAPYIYIRNA